jgi:alkylation response protein AidB-like acyl-CoA dehydrogenase
VNLLPTAEQRQIVDSLTSFLSARAPVSRLRPPAPQIGNSDHRLFRDLGDLGVFGCGLPEAAGGIGLSAAEESLIFRELGRYLLSPAVFAMTLGAHLLASADEDLRSKFIEGGARAGIANPRGRFSLAAPGHGDARARGDARTRGDAQAHGDVHLLDCADTEWVILCDESGTGLFRRSDFTDVQPVPSMDNLITLHRARLEDVKPFFWSADADHRLHERASLLLSAFAVGIAEATRDMAVDYAKTREQFGRPIGSFQAIKHICADMAIRCEAALSQTTFASLVIAEGQEGAAFHVTSCKLVAAAAAVKNASQNIQVHGAIGFTAEAEPHLFLKRAHVVEQLWGDTRRCRERLLSLNLPGAS